MNPRPFRNNNPGDLESGDHWQGLMPTSRLSDAQLHERFAVFETPEWGFRALVILLHNYKKLYGANTVRKVVDRFAPPNENPPTYRTDVADALNVMPDTYIDLDNHDTLFALAKAMAKFETGSWEPYWHDTQLAKGIAMTGMFGTQELVA